jgi:hypothetical protein
MVTMIETLRKNLEYYNLKKLSEMTKLHPTHLSAIKAGRGEGVRVATYEKIKQAMHEISKMMEENYEKTNVKSELTIEDQ